MIPHIHFTKKSTLHFSVRISVATLLGPFIVLVMSEGDKKFRAMKSKPRRVLTVLGTLHPQDCESVMVAKMVSHFTTEILTKNNILYYTSRTVSSSQSTYYYITFAMQIPRKMLFIM